MATRPRRPRHTQRRRRWRIRHTAWPPMTAVRSCHPPLRAHRFLGSKRDRS
ncbi:hypothetical protein BURMUCGD2M_6536 [Burkholderia multivorans CGD2M]|uniref:Uncharacterized protein n=1 Tax=Burkholderia multivorans CGD2 TaxID=513052 RepID=B9BPC5_9BURK|nr:hypothetical protein BURMUCGD2_6546 [Burkholderia multivorans CGD2]EEE13814.1 hypothetical protein BURMUCGD2M_6536 [Burkholderia multivorans CGD2M]